MNGTFLITEFPSELNTIKGLQTTELPKLFHKLHFLAPRNLK